MSYDLVPRNKDAGDFRFGAFSWPVLFGGMWVSLPLR